MLSFAQQNISNIELYECKNIQDFKSMLTLQTSLTGSNMVSMFTIDSQLEKIFKFIEVQYRGSEATPSSIDVTRHQLHTSLVLNSAKIGTKLQLLIQI